MGGNRFVPAVGLGVRWRENRLGQLSSCIEEEENSRRGSSPAEVGEGAPSLSEVDCVLWLLASKGLDSVTQEVPRSCRKGDDCGKGGRLCKRSASAPAAWQERSDSKELRMTGRQICLLSYSSVRQALLTT